MVKSEYLGNDYPESNTREKEGFLLCKILFEWHEVSPYSQLYNFNLQIDGSRKKSPLFFCTSRTGF